MGVTNRKLLKLKASKVDSLSALPVFYCVIVLFFIAIPGGVSAQNSAQDVTVKKNGKKYYRHIVDKGETIYGIAEKYNEKPKDIILENPTAMDGIHPGDTLMIPIVVKTMVDTTSVSNNYIYHDVTGKETLYSLSKRYNTTVGAIDSLNPGLAGEGLKVGQRIRIPNTANKIPKKHSTTKDTVKTAKQAPANGNKNEVQAYKSLLGGQPPANNQAQNIPVKQEASLETFSFASDTGEKLSRYNVALIMPFASDGADTLRLNRLLAGTEQIPLVTQISIDFYHGIIEAFDSLARKGLKVNLHVYNISAGTDTSSYAIDSILKNPEIVKMNLIIGPPSSVHFKRVARFAGIHNIPIVSPLSDESNVLKNNPWTSKIRPSILTETEFEADYIASHYSRNNIIVIHNRDAGEQYYEAFKKRFHITDSTLGNRDTLRFAESIGGVTGLASKISNNQVNIIVMPYQGAPFVAKFVNELANSRYARKDSLHLFGMHNWASNDALAPDNLDTLGFHFPSNEFVNYTDKPVKKFIAKYRDNYLSEPSYYSYEGYDAAMFYGSLLYTYGTAMQQHLGDMKYKGLQTSFNMVRLAPTTGYENRAVYILEYSNYTEKPDFQ